MNHKTKVKELETDVPSETVEYTPISHSVSQHESHCAALEAATDEQIAQELLNIEHAPLSRCCKEELEAELVRRNTSK